MDCPNCQLLKEKLASSKEDALRLARMYSETYSKYETLVEAVNKSALKSYRNKLEEIVDTINADIEILDRTIKITLKESIDGR
jgi:uncharacterized FlaG/YvyC family protein